MSAQRTGDASAPFIPTVGAARITKITMYPALGLSQWYAEALLPDGMTVHLSALYGATEAEGLAEAERALSRLSPLLSQAPVKE